MSKSTEVQIIRGLETMFYHSYTPAPPLGDFVEQFWLCSDAPAHRRARILPHGTIELKVNLCEDEIRILDPTRTDRRRRHSGTVVSGAYGGFFVTKTRNLQPIPLIFT